MIFNIALNILALIRIVHSYEFLYANLSVFNYTNTTPYLGYYNKYVGYTVCTNSQCEEKKDKNGQATCVCKTHTGMSCDNLSPEGCPPKCPEGCDRKETYDKKCYLKTGANKLDFNKTCGCNDDENKCYSDTSLACNATVKGCPPYCPKGCGRAAGLDFNIEEDYVCYEFSGTGHDSVDPKKPCGCNDKNVCYSYTNLTCTEENLSKEKGCPPSCQEGCGREAGLDFSTVEAYEKNKKCYQMSETGVDRTKPCGCNDDNVCYSYTSMTCNNTSPKGCPLYCPWGCGRKAGLDFSEEKEYEKNNKCYKQIRAGVVDETIECVASGTVLKTRLVLSLVPFFVLVILAI